MNPRLPDESVDIRLVFQPFVYKTWGETLH
jgi:hypothetical protein